MRKILVSITTTRGSDWRDKIKEVEKLGLKEVALFPTCLNEKERQELYSLLEKTKIESIPFVHIRNDMSPKELDYLITRFKAEVFNIHTNREFPFIYDYQKHKKMIFIENVYSPLDEAEVSEFGGICLDVSHLANDKIYDPEKFKYILKVLEKYPIGCNHASAFTKNVRRDEEGYLRLDSHRLQDLSEMDYLKEYPKEYFSNFVAIELENSLARQLEIRDYLIKKIGL
jgi:hypothetical protein